MRGLTARHVNITMRRSASTNRADTITCMFWLRNSIGSFPPLAGNGRLMQQFLSQPSQVVRE